jgi:hypothetical protein
MYQTLETRARHMASLCESVRRHVERGQEFLAKNFARMDWRKRIYGHGRRPQ